MTPQLTTIINVSLILNKQNFLSSDDWYSGRHRRSVNLGNQKVCRILLVADHYFFNGIGGRSIPSTQNYMVRQWWPDTRFISILHKLSEECQFFYPRG